MATIRIAVDSAEVATLKPDGRPWDGPGRSRIPQAELASFFAASLDDQLDRLAQDGEPPVPPDVFVRLFADEDLVLETHDEKSFDPRWEGADREVVELPDWVKLKMQVWDRDVLFDDLIGETKAEIPEARGRGKEWRWELGPFGQVRKLVLQIG